MLDVIADIIRGIFTSRKARAAEMLRKSAKQSAGQVEMAAERLNSVSNQLLKRYPAKENNQS